jgi:hypothetical protein
MNIRDRPEIHILEFGQIGVMTERLPFQEGRIAALRLRAYYPTPTPEIFGLTVRGAGERTTRSRRLSQDDGAQAEPLFYQPGIPGFSDRLLDGFNGQTQLRGKFRLPNDRLW